MHAWMQRICCDVKVVCCAGSVAQMHVLCSAVSLSAWHCCTFSRVPPIVKLVQAAGGMDGAPVEASTAAATATWVPSLHPDNPAYQTFAGVMIRATAAAELASMFWSHAEKPAWLSWLQQQSQQQQLLHPEVLGMPGTAAQQPWQAHPAMAAAAAGGVQQQLVSVLSYLAQQHNQPEMYCMDAAVLAYSC
jgi:hypothetical protein